MWARSDVFGFRLCEEFNTNLSPRGQGQRHVEQYAERLMCDVRITTDWKRDSSRILLENFVSTIRTENDSKATVNLKSWEAPGTSD